MLGKELSDEEIANLSDAEFKTLVIRMLTDLIELSLKMKEEMKATQSEIKENIQEPIMKGRKLGLKSMIWKRKEETNIQPEQNEETGIQKNKERLRNFWDNFKHSNI